jgi:hypothetical protein
MTMDEYTVSLWWDDEARKWYALNNGIPIALEDVSLDNLISRVKLAAPEMLELNGTAGSRVRLFFKMETRTVLA